MKIKTSTGRKIRYGSTSILIVALVLAIVIALNATVTLLTQKFMWYGDMTPEAKFTLSEECITLLGEEDPNNGQVSAIEKLKKRTDGAKINILFPLEKDVAKSTDPYVYNMAEELRAKFKDYVTTEYVDALSRPKRFEKYLSSTTETIDLNSIIIECGTQFRIRTFKSFYLYYNGQPWAYHAEKSFASSILAVTSAQTPLACYTNNHQETFLTTTGFENKTVVNPLLTAVENAGYRVQPLDLSKEEIPEDCRLLITFNPKDDFESEGGNRLDNKSDELKKLDKFLEDRNSYMVFLDPKVGELPVLEGFLEEWGLVVRRDKITGEAVTLRDSANSVLNNQNALISEYTQNDFMAGVAEDLSAKVVFENAMIIDYAKDYKKTTQSFTKDNKTIEFTLAHNDSSGRKVFSMFNTSATAEGYLDGENVWNATKKERAMLMAMSTKSYTEQEGNWGSITDSAYVMLCGSVDFAAPKYLQSKAYGNDDLLLTAFSLTGREPVPVGLEPKPLANFKIESISARAATICTVVLTLMPLAIAFGAGTIILVRRKNR